MASRKNGLSTHFQFLSRQNTECTEKKKHEACVCNRSQYSVVVKYLKVVHWSRGWGLGLGWGPAQSTIWILRSCQTTTQTHTHTHTETYTQFRVCQTTQGARGPRGLRWWAGAAAVQTTHTPYTLTPKMHIHTLIHCHLKKNCTVSYLNHTLTPTRHTLTHLRPPSFLSSILSQLEGEIMREKRTDQRGNKKHLSTVE